MSWFWMMWSETYGAEIFDSYDTKRQALAGRSRVKAKEKKLNDGIIRCYSDPYQR